MYANTAMYGPATPPSSTASRQTLPAARCHRGRLGRGTGRNPTGPRASATLLPTMCSTVPRVCSPYTRRCTSRSASGFRVRQGVDRTRTSSEGGTIQNSVSTACHLGDMETPRPSALCVQRFPGVPVQGAHADHRDRDEEEMGRRQAAVATSAAPSCVRRQIQAERRMKARSSTSSPMESP